jgi:hypothetical protein
MSELANITVSTRANEMLERLKQERYFDSHLEAYRSAILISIAQDLPVNREVEFQHNKWDTAAVFYNEDQPIALLMQMLGYDKEKIVIEGKYLAETGLEFLESKLQKNLTIFPYLLGV